MGKKGSALPPLSSLPHGHPKAGFSSGEEVERVEAGAWAEAARVPPVPPERGDVGTLLFFIPILFGRSFGSTG